MQLTLLALVAGILAHDALPMPMPAPLGTAIALLIGPKLLLAGYYTWKCRRVLLTLGTKAAADALPRLDRASSLFRTGVLVLFAGDLWAGSLNHLRALFPSTLNTATGNPILVDEFFFLLPSLLMHLWAWNVYYPIDRRLREAMLIHQFDVDGVFHGIWSRKEYLICQIRHQMALVLVPMLLLIGWHECVEAFARDRFDIMPQALLQLSGAAGIFLFSPVMIRYLWDTAPIPEGELRDHLLALCRQYRVGVCELLEWRTHGGMINAAVMGLIRPLRFILLSDGLVENLPRPEVVAVMTHELAHVRKHHTLWLLLVAITLIGTLTLACKTTAYLLVIWGGYLEQTSLAVNMATMAVIATGWVAGFGWVSRRFERQADVFAVGHMAENEPVGDRDVEAMAGALGRVARLNHVSETRRSWRHGSIAWRQAYLRTLVGTAPCRWAIDRVVGRIKWATLLGLAMLVALAAW